MAPTWASPVGWGTCLPFSQACPEVAVTSPSRIRSVVVLPAPFGPRKPNTWPASTVRSSPASAVVPRYLLVSPRHSMTAVTPASALRLDAPRPGALPSPDATLGGSYAGVVSTGTSSVSSSRRGRRQVVDPAQPRWLVTAGRRGERRGGGGPQRRGAVSGVP